jgi:hypothetical protein
LRGECALPGAAALTHLTWVVLSRVPKHGIVKIFPFFPGTTGRTAMCSGFAAAADGDREPGKIDGECAMTTVPPCELTPRVTTSKTAISR